MKFNQIIVGAALAVSAVAAQAAAPKFVVSSTVIDLPANDDATFGQKFNGSNSGAYFLDIYNFTLASTSTVGISFSSADVGQKKLSFDSIGLYANGGNTSLYDGSVFSVPGFSAGGLTQTLSAGTYSFRIGGTVLGKAGGSYTGGVSVSPVPEPETWGMTLSGLAAVGLLARRRKIAQSA